MIDGRIKLRHLQCFIAVTQQQSIQRAAHALCVTQPAVSKTVRELEDILGVRLFERGRQGTLPTRDAQLLLRHANAAIGALMQGIDSLSDAQRDAGITLAVGALPTVAPALMPDIVQRLRAEAPRVALRVATGSNQQLLAQLRASDVDAVLGRLSDPEQMLGLTFEHLYAEPLALAVRPHHPLLAQPAVSIDQLARYPAVLPNPGTAIRHAADSLLAAHAASPARDHVETLSVALGRALVATSDAIWFVPEGAVQRDLADGVLARLPIDTAGTEEPVGLLLRRDSVPSASLAAFVTAAHRAAADRRGPRIRV